MVEYNSEHNIDLDSVLSDTNSVVTEPTPNVIAEQSVPDLDKILLEWSWRCSKGYPDFNDPRDRIELQEVLNEMGIESPFGELTEATPIKDARLDEFPKSFISKMKSAGKLDKFYEYLDLMPGGDALPEISSKITNICSNKADEAELVKLFKTKTLEDLLSIDISSGIYKRLYTVRPKGTGPGEILISWIVDGAMFQGGNVSHDIVYDGQHWEVKSLIDSAGGSTPNSIDPAEYGRISKYKISKDIQSFFESIVEPYYKNKLKDPVLSLSESPEVKTKLENILSFLETIPRMGDKGSLYADSINEMGISVFNKFYEAISGMHKLLPKSVKDTAKVSRIIVKTNANDSQYWITPDDADSIIKTAGKDKEVSVKVGARITDENKDAKIWLSNLMNNVFIKTPDYFIESLKKIRDGFAEGKDGLIYLTPPGKVNVVFDMDDFFTSHITRGVFRFNLKNRKSYAGFKYAQEQ